MKKMSNFEKITKENNKLSENLNKGNEEIFILQ